MIKELFQKRLTAFCDNLFFNKQDLWKHSDVVVIHTQQQENPNSLSSQFYLWLCGEKFQNTTTIFTPSGIYFLCTEKNYSKIRFLCCPATLVRKTPVSVQLKAKSDDGFALIDSTISNARAICNSKGFNFGGDENWPFVVGYIEGEYPKSKLFWCCMKGLESGRYKIVTVNSGINKMFSMSDKPNFGDDCSREEKDFLKSPMFSTSDKPNFGAECSREEKDSLKSLSDMCADDYEPLILPFRKKGNQSALMFEEKRNLESKFGRLGLSEEGRSDLGSEFDMTKIFSGDKPRSRMNEVPLPTTKTNGDDSRMMEYLKRFLPTLPSGEQDKSRGAHMFPDHRSKFGGIWFDDGKEYNHKAGNKNGVHVFKFGESISDCKEYKSKEISKNGDLVFKSGASKLDGKDCKSKEGNKNGDQLFTFGGEGKKDGDQLFKFGEQCKIGEKRGRNNQPQLIMEENKSKKEVKQLTERLTAFYSSWRKYKEEQWGKADVLVITTPTVAKVENLSRSFLVWLLDDEFPETTTVFTDTGIEFLCTKESFFRLRKIGIRMTMVAKVTVSVQLKKRGERCVDWLKKTLWQVNTAAKSGTNRCPLVVGCISGEFEVEVLAHSKSFEVAYVDSSLANLLEQGNFEKPESFSAQQSTFPEQFQMLSLGTCSGAKTANAVSFSELAKIRSMDDNSYLSLISKELCSGAKTHTDLDNGVPVEKSKPEENKVLEEDNSSRKLADKMMLLEIKEGDMETSITEDSAEEKLLAEEENMLLNLENSPLLQVKEHGGQSRPTAEGGMDDGVQPTGVTHAASESPLPDDNNGSLRKDSVGSDREDDDWTLIEMECLGQETEVAERVSWRRWFMDKAGKSFGLKDEVSDEAPSKRTKADP